MTSKNNPQEACEYARKAYVNAFTRQALYKMKDKLPRKQWREMMAQLMDRTPEWHAYQEAWMLAYAREQVINPTQDNPLKKWHQRGSARSKESRKSTLRIKALQQKQ
jgi:hypothetical protein